MSELPGEIRVQDAVLANMVSIAAILEYLDQSDPGARAAIDQRAQEIASAMKQGEDENENGPE